MARVLVAVPDPLDLEHGGQPLQLDEFVTIRVVGRVMRGVVPLPRTALREGDKAWVCKGDVLDIRPVDVAWSGRDTVYVSSGLEPGDLVVTTDISGPVQGMRLRIEGRDSALAPPKAVKKANSTNDAEVRHAG